MSNDGLPFFQMIITLNMFVHLHCLDIIMSESIALAYNQSSYARTNMRVSVALCIHFSLHTTYYTFISTAVTAPALLFCYLCETPHKSRAKKPTALNDGRNETPSCNVLIYTCGRLGS